MSKVWIFGIIVLSILLSVNCALAESNDFSSSDNETPWTGVWQSMRYYETLTQVGNEVSGPYVPFDSSVNDIGVINGTISDNASVVTGTWSESGDITLTPSDDNSTMDVVWAYDTLEHFIKSDGDTSLDGTWNSENLTLSLDSEGTEVSGIYSSLLENSNVGGYFNGTISLDGTEITGTFVEEGDFTFIISDDGSYFNGTYTYGSDMAKEDDTWNAIRVS